MAKCATSCSGIFRANPKREPDVMLWRRGCTDDDENLQKMTALAIEKGSHWRGASSSQSHHAEPSCAGSGGTARDDRCDSSTFCQI